MKLVFISYGNIPSKWAHTVQMMKMAEALNKRVDKFCLLTQCDWPSLFRAPFDYFGWYGIQNPFRIIRLPLLPKQSSPLIEAIEFPYYNQIASLYAKLIGPGIVYTRAAHIADICVRLRLPVILESHMDTDHPRYTELLKAGNSPFLKAVVTISPFLKETYIESGVSEDKIIVAYDAVDLSRFDQLDSTRSIVELKSQMGLPLDLPIITYAGHLYAHKGIGTIIEAANQLSDCFFHIVGGWEKDVSRYKNETQHLTNIKFTGFVPNEDIPQHLAVSDILLLPNSANHPSAQYTSPMKLFEYMAASKPIIASDIAALRPVLRHGENAWLVEPDNVESLATAVKFLLTDHQMSHTLAQNAHRDVQNYTWDRRAEKVLGQVAV